MKHKKRWIVASVAILVIIVLFFTVMKKDNNEDVVIQAANSLSPYEETYKDYLNEHGYGGIKAKDEIDIDLFQYIASDKLVVSEDTEGVTTGDVGTITWKFNVETTGFYNLQLSYIAGEGTTSDIQRQILLDGDLCYEGMQQIVLKRFWEDGEIKEKNGNEIRPSAKEIFHENTVFIEDYSRRSTEPYLFFLESGEHTVSFEGIKEPVKYTGLSFQVMKDMQSYQDVIDELKSKYSIYSSESIVFQAERKGGNTTKIEKSSASINIQKNYTDSELIPYHPYNIIYNTIGGDSWKISGDVITWEFQVNQEGLYEISFKGRQSSKRGVTSYRRLAINGEVPYSEMEAVPFDFSSEMKHYTIEDENGEPYLFYMKKGTNSISLEVVLGDFGSVLTMVEESMLRLNQLYLRTIQLTGQAPDKYIDYEVSTKIPDFSETMSNESKQLFAVRDELVRITGEKGESTSLIEKMAIQAQNLAKDPEKVVESLGQLKNNIAALGTWTISISNMPLELDSFVISAPKGELPVDRQGFFAGLYNGTVRFMSTFFINRSQMNSESVSKEDNTEKNKVLTVWMASSGKEQAQILQNMIDETFTPATDISIKLQLIPVDVVLRAAIAGNGPDVVVGLAQTTLADFAIRDAIVDVSKLDGFEEEAQRYNKSAITAATFQDGVYGLADQENFMMLFYRKDILDTLGLSIPQTWDDVKEMIPVLQKNNYSFYLPSSTDGPLLYPSMVYQNGGNLYQGEDNDYGIASALSSDAAMEAFKQYTDFFTSYKLPVKAEFSNRFRTGEIPIGIANYTTYCQLEIFAPEIKGLWSFAPLPGTTLEDGSIDHTYLSETVQSVIMSNSDKVEDAWTFIKWWTGTKTQLQYANTLETVMGTAARYPAADRNVIKQLPWGNYEMTQLLAQMDENICIPAVPGHYMTTRMIQYAFNKVVSESQNPRETLYLKMKSIDKELLKKRAEFSLSTLK